MAKTSNGPRNWTGSPREPRRRPWGDAGTPLDPVLLLCKAHGLPLPEKEHRFCERRWRFDYCWPDRFVALEVEGGVWSGGRHTRGAGFIRDLEKYNAATLKGWSVFRATPSQVQSAEILPMLKEALA